MILLEWLFELVVQLVLQLAVEFLWELVLNGVRAGTGATTRRTTTANAIRGIKYAVLGGLNGWLSVLFWPRPVFHTAGVTGVSLILGTLSTGLVMWWIGRRWPNRAVSPDSLLHFWTAFDFAFGFALIRLAFAMAWLP